MESHTVLRALRVSHENSNSLAIRGRARSSGGATQGRLYNWAGTPCGHFHSPVASRRIVETFHGNFVVSTPFG